MRLRSNGHCQVRVLEGGLVCHSEVDCFQIVSLLKEVSGMAQNPLIDWFCLCYFIRNGLAALLEGVFARKTNLNPGRLYDNDQRWWCNSILSQVPVPGTQGDSNKKQNCHQRSGSRDSDLSNVYFLYKSKFNLYRHVQMKFNQLSQDSLPFIVWLKMAYRQEDGERGKVLHCAIFKLFVQWAVRFLVPAESINLQILLSETTGDFW